MGKRKSNQDRSGCGALFVTLLSALIDLVGFFLQVLFAIAGAIFQVSVAALCWLNNRKVTLPMGEGFTISWLAALAGVVVIMSCSFFSCTFFYGVATSTMRGIGILPTYTPVPTNTSTPTQTLTPSPTPTSTPTPTLTPTPRPTNTPTSTNTPTPEFERTEAQVVKVVDGDTIKVDIGGEVYTVRYIGIDTPETVHPDKPVEWMGPEASEANKQLVGGKTVYLEKDVSETDQYGRLLRYVYLPDGTFVNAELVRLGYAQSSTYPPDVRHQDLFVEMQQEARENERGLWGATPTFPPVLTATTEPTPLLPTPTQPPQPTATQLPQPTTVPTQPPATVGDVKITYIYYDGQVPRVESDEYAVIRNNGGSLVNLAGWRLNAGAPGQDFIFPNFELQPGQECRVYTNEIHPDFCGFSFGSGQALWRNSGDCGYLYDANNNEVSSYCY
jgi:endonuclease YncB( thermonuclease family)